MGIFSQSTAGAFRYTSDGRRLYRKRYLVADADLEQVESRYRIQAALGMPLVIAASTIARQHWGNLWGWLAFLLILPLSFLSRVWVTEGLPLVTIRDSELEPVDRQAVDLAYAQAKGRPAMWFLICLMVATAVLGGYLAFTDGGWSGWFLMLVMPWGALKLFQQVRRLPAE